MRANSRMSRLMEKHRDITHLPTFAAQEQTILDAGWMIGPHGGLYLRALGTPKFDPGRADDGLREYHHNDVRLEINGSLGANDLMLSDAAFRAIFFSRTLLHDAIALLRAEHFVSVIGLPGDVKIEDFSLQGITIRFFSCRGAHPDWFSDLEGYESEALAVMTLDDL